MTVQATGAPCSTCGRPWSPADFYGPASTECRPCKQIRSRTNRAIAARKIALAERLVDALVELARQGWHPSPPCQEAPIGGARVQIRSTNS